MARIFQESPTWAEVVDGFVAVNAPSIRRAPGGVVRAGEGTSATVAVVVGGAFEYLPGAAAFVGEGMAHAAALGDAAPYLPTADNIYEVAKAALPGRGVLFCHPADPTLNARFAQVQERLRAEGIDCANVAVHDDTFSHRAAGHERPGLYGEAAVLKIAGAAAAAGWSLDQVFQVAERANLCTQSLRADFLLESIAGDTAGPARLRLGADRSGLNAFGETEVPGARQMAGLLVGELLERRPFYGSPGDQPGQVASGGRVAVIVQGSNGVSESDLLLLWTNVARELTAAGHVPIAPVAGNLTSGLNPLAVSITFLWLDSELERLWLATADAPAFHRGMAGAASLD
ncbi:dihydroxyacetone kinase subunit DhaK [Arthrobacter sp. SA17]